ncbi:integral membrane sensor signal transduction histidine kinase [Anaeromyxobacter sp. K]|uniref:sensor histidine kinase n=1 Tax=Anaeromyxobacter sp. (strain K) TaxID=447217 RepID=UPI00015F8405|nr:ATP-binding protein [Anaeromyxobacter sp. K]ACG73305.1 integral membrane sensor signal transduction histidine kinase [Anaeromyxobacter sp. K]
MRRLLAVLGTLRGRLVLLVCFATLPAMLFTFYAASAERTAVLRRIEQEALLLAQLASREHGHQLEGARTLLRRLAGLLRAAPEAGDAARCPELLPALLAGYPQFTTIGILSPEGRLRCSARAAPPGVSFAGNAALDRALRSSDVEVGEYAVGPVVGRPVLHLAYAVRAAGGAPVEVLFVGLDLQWLEQLAHQAELPAGYALVLADRNGTALGRSGDDAWPARAARDPALARAVDAAGQGTVAEVPGADRRFLVAAPVAAVPGVSVVASLPYTRVAAQANRAFYRTVAGLALLTLFTIGCVLLAAEVSVLRVLRHLARTARRFGEGDLAARAETPAAHGELAELTRAFNAMADALAARQREAADIQGRLRAMSHRLAAAREAEAAAIARDLHDELGQVLTSVKVDLAALQRAGAEGEDPQARRARVAELGQRLDEAVGFVRRVSSDLRPPVLDRLGLAAALEGLVRDLEQRTRLAVILDVDPSVEPVEWLPAITLFRIVREALTNVVRHAGATEVWIELRATPAARVLTVRDDGKGIGPWAADDRRALGIQGMQERALLVDGTFEISGTPGGGTTIVVTIPRTRTGGPDAAHPAG